MSTTFLSSCFEREGLRKVSFLSGVEGKIVEVEDGVLAATGSEAEPVEFGPLGIAGEIGEFKFEAIFADDGGFPAAILFSGCGFDSDSDPGADGVGDEFSMTVVDPAIFERKAGTLSIACSFAAPFALEA